MTTFDDREKGFEAKFAHDAEMEFRIAARRNRLMGLWAAERLGLSEAEAEAYARTVIQADFEEAGDDDVVRKIVADFVKAGIEIGDLEVRAQLGRMFDAARAQVGAS